MIRRFAFLALVLGAACHGKHGDAYKFATLVARGDRACATMKDGSVRCWGKTGARGDRKPTVVEGLTGASKVCVAGDAVCALGKDGRASCLGTTVEHAGDLACSTNRACAIADGKVLCWTAHRTPAPVQGTNGATSIAVGEATACAILVDGSVSCWADGDAALVAGLTASAIAIGGRHTCAVTKEQTVACFGANDDGELGSGDQASATPVAVPGVVGATAIACGEHHSCARVSDGAIFCWGKNDVHQSRLAPSLTAPPTRVDGLYEADGVALGDDFTCALMQDGWVRCFGVNDWGQLGDGTTEIRNVPTPITL
ncbi:MAG TPA: hypothetical protein VGH28_15360 [Polyangiaceae bacterium]